ncbi:unnamed protein product [Clonostachys chloroleuca]|uniref:Aldehyde dehydrogenase domain-containing protein n=1 Tax=Clonostachys chloroleuca TaxID=1926264 RepID=A0AA35LNP9_9HYPO|nr:unnamed protein product [Clonostachys chloroleuca]
MASVLDRYRIVNAAWTEGRLENVLQRQKELALLHANIKKFSSDLIKAICHDVQISNVSAADELELTLELIRQLYDSLDFPGALSKEKLVRNGGSRLDNLVPLGPVLIDASPYSPFASVLAPLAAAVAAGSAAIVLVPSQTSKVNIELRTLIAKSLDFEAFAITEDDSTGTRQQLGSKYFGAAALQNLAERDSLSASLYKANPQIRILSPPSGVPAAFVDRSAQDLEAVSSHLLQVGPNAPRANPLRIPRLVFVDEIHIDQLEKSIYAGSGANQQLSFPNDKNKSRAFVEFVQSTLPSIRQISRADGHLPAVITLHDSNEIVFENVHKAVEVLAESTNGLLLVSTRSLDHGIDILNKINANNPSQAVYVFAAPKASSYVALFTNTLQVFINSIPRWSLATVAPFTSNATDRLPYRREDFSVNKPITQEPLKPVQALTTSANAGTPLRRVVTHHSGSSSAVLSDDKIPLSSGFGSNAVTIWRNDKYPAELVDKDPVSTSPVIYAPGSLIRVVDFPPNSFGHNHRTASLDYGIVMGGELEMVLSDGSKTIVHAGDVVVQQATLHQWNNLTNKWCRMMFVLLPSEKTVHGISVTEVGVPEKYLPENDR